MCDSINDSGGIKKTMRSVSGAIAVSTVVLSACAREPSAPTLVTADPPSTALAAKAAVSASPTIAIDDALSRIVAGLDATTAASLKGPLTAVKTALGNRNAAVLQGAIAVARQALAGPAAAKDERAPDLAAIALALDAAAAAN